MPKNAYGKFFKQVTEVSELNGTFIADLAEIMAKGDFDPIKGDVKPNEEVVGEMNVFEKALDTLINNLAKQATKLAEEESSKEKDIILDYIKKQEDIESICLGCITMDDKELAVLSRKKEQLIGLCKNLTGIMWFSIENRLADKDKPESTGWGIRSGYKIVLMTKSNEEEYIEKRTKEMTNRLMQIILSGRTQRGSQDGKSPAHEVIVKKISDNLTGLIIDKETGHQSTESARLNSALTLLDILQSMSIPDKHKLEVIDKLVEMKVRLQDKGYQTLYDKIQATQNIIIA